MTKVAIIAVHGVANQDPGDTGRAVASMLVGGEVQGARYTKASIGTHVLPVPPLAPLRRANTQDMLPTTGKALRQSAGSDFQRTAWTAASQLADSAQPAAPAAGAAHPTQQDAGIAFTDYLLFKAQRDAFAKGGQSPSETYETTTIHMARETTGQHPAPPAQRIDVHEMYWADLSRLSSALPSIVTEVFTMVFRLSRLGRDTIDQAVLAATAQEAASRAAGASPQAMTSARTATRNWRKLATAQRWLDQLLSLGLANLFTQLMFVGLMIAVFGVLKPHAGMAHGVLWVAVPLLLVWWLWYQHGPDWSALSYMAVVASVGVLLHLLPAPLVVGLACMVVVCVVCDWGWRVTERRFPGTQIAGRVLLALVMLALAGQVACAWAHGARSLNLDTWIVACMHLVEWLLVAIVVWWFVAGFLALFWLWAGRRAHQAAAAAQVARAQAQALAQGMSVAQTKSAAMLAQADATVLAKSTVATGRLGFFVSLASFVVVAMALWAVLTAIVEAGGHGVLYNPLVFKMESYSDAVNGNVFLHDRYVNSTEPFSIVAVLMLSLLVYVLATLLPSVLSEMKTEVGSAQQLGRWLSRGYLWLDRCVTWLATLSGVVAALIGTLLLAARLPESLPMVPELKQWSDNFRALIGQTSEDWLKPLVLTTATAGALFTALGGYLSRAVPAIRGPLDVMLDVDNHFREFPRNAIPRARIFARYVALLEHVAAQNYDKIVIVAHSQGSVITAELLRYMHDRARRAAPASSDWVVQLWPKLHGRLHLMTAGCPLRQLYAARFPDRYGWVLTDAQGQPGPSHKDVGVQRWLNVYASGDYVGRWVWSNAAPGQVPGGAYAVRPPGPFMSVAVQEDVCVGAGAHTHYFDISQWRVEEYVDALVR